MSRGTAFIKFKDISTADSLITKYEKIRINPKEKKEMKEEGERKKRFWGIEQLIFRGRNLLLSRAVTRKDLKQYLWKEWVMDRRMAEREMAAKDNRNTYLLTEGEIDEENRGDMNDRGNVHWMTDWSDFEKRQQNQKEKETKLRNPLFFVNPHRLLVKNLGPHITSNYLKQICI